PLHKTVSLFIKDLPATTTVKEVEDICKNYPGYMRLVLQDPMPPHFTRRGWVTFQPWVNVKDVCWSLIGHKVCRVYVPRLAEFSFVVLIYL
ncbi:hypothetical protein HELRODRAFT_93075, partial [Helobdella robusta]|uniref:RRM domain-containing protein n=1 Tax=Helobdella robusta TaxID=6412 RepID=T1G8S7_HELRO